MDWTVHWFMFPVCIGIASAAMFSGISGAVVLMPVFLIGFPLLGAPTLTTVAAVGMSLFLETSGFGTGLYRYLRRGLVDVVTARQLGTHLQGRVPQRATQVSSPVCWASSASCSSPPSASGSAPPP